MFASIMKNKWFTRQNIYSLSVLSASHAVVDLICSALLIFLLVSNKTGFLDIAFFIFEYNVLAFGTQFVFGAISDNVRMPKQLAILGALLTGLSPLFVFSQPHLAIILAGFGNALFHVGAGTISLGLTPKKASAPGVFVAPGAFGLFIGAFLANQGLFDPALLFALAVVFSFLMIFTVVPKLTFKFEKPKMAEFGFIILVLLLFVIVLRSLVGASIIFPWKAEYLLVFTFFVVFGKAFGGILGDKFGWIKIGVGGAAISAPLIIIGATNPLVGLVGIFLFNLTMPITLVALAGLFPGRPGTAFGMNCLALLVGVLPFFIDAKAQLPLNEITFVGPIISAVLLFIALKLFFKKR